MRLCIDLGASNVKGALVEGGAVLKAAQVPTRHGMGRGGVVSSLTDAVEALLCPSVDCLCVASAGDIDEETGICTYATGNLEEFTGFDFPAYAREKFSLPCYAANDAYCALLGEMMFGAGRAYRNARVAMLTLGSGVGGAYWDGKKLVSSASRGEHKLGHLVLHEGGTPCNCGKNGCIEQYLSGRAINRLVRANGMESDSLFPRLNAGDETAKRVAEQVADDLALAAERVGKLFPFDVLMLGGGVAESIGAGLSLLASRAPRPLVLASLGNRAGVMGAYCLAEDKV